MSASWKAPRADRSVLPAEPKRVLPTSTDKVTLSPRFAIPSETPARGEIAALTQSLLAEGVRGEASDIHIKGQSDGVLVRYRINGLLHDVQMFSSGIGRRIVHHLKALGGMNIIERRRPQDGRVILQLERGEVDFRLSTIHTLWGENMAIRVFDKGGELPKLRDLGFQTQEFQVLYDLIHHPQGLMLVTGPTGAGKTTSLYAILNHISRPEVNIITVEDPVEYEIPRANQIGVQPRIDVGFLECLRAAFRQDPDVLMIGEIRDAETARIAVRAALSGHLVFSTLHTGTSAEAIAALVNLGIEPFLLSTALVGVMAQQLLRRICDDCRTKVPLEVKPEELDPVYRAEMLRVLKPGQPFSFSYGKGCDTCFRSGYRGRTGLFEILRVTSAVRAEIMKKSPAETIEDVAVQSGMMTMRSAGMRLVIQGKTTSRRS